ncbi:transketolase family protein [Kineosporia succinea]|uniref:Transketolase n=1 Tax=Kineosporia succinea TaxID=84632 RepID=A0ABT9PBR0_9ACTN|nr:transketolase C-terminal domain-containing protein [Kineosporia succinea]MDP9830142.1 transketolase [Kineosporia succinea]
MTTTLEPQTFDCRQAFAETLIDLARADDRIVAVCNDSVGSSNLVAFREEFPDRLVNVGIAEQNMVGVGAGLANAGLVPFVCAAGPFLTGRATEQIKTDVAYSDRAVVLCAMSPGMAYGELGPTHHSIEDLAWMRAVANLDILVPADPAQTRAAVRWAAGSKRPVFMRVGRHKVPGVSDPADPFVFGRADVLSDGSDVTIFATGTPVSRALGAAGLLARQGVGARVVNVSTISPLDEATVLAAARETGFVLTVEEATTTGGLGAAIGEIVLRHHPVPLRMLGVPRVFAPTGDNDYLLETFGLTAEGIAAAVLDLRN